MGPPDRRSLRPDPVTIKGWRFESAQGPILNGRERDALTEKIKGTMDAEGLPPTVPSLPEAIFGHNRLTLTHEASGHTFNFDAEGAITQWVADKQAMGAIDYDWTFSTSYCGTMSNSTRFSADGAGVGAADSRGGQPSFIESRFCTKVEYEAWLGAYGGEAGARKGGAGEGGADEAPLESQWRVHKGRGLDMALLRRQDVPILHFVDIPLFEDDLGDNGDSVIRARLRVMPTCFLVLVRHALRVDGLLIRHHDTRIFHKFGEPHVLRARRLGEAPLAPLPNYPKSPDKSYAPAAAPWAATAPPLGTAMSHPDERQAAERLAMLPPKSESIEELLL